ncbi:ABC transporter ATP-binding protein [Streptomyces sp. SM14]|uniref:ATP-binding cassette domain-containing protein n=1 Tax=Streptomyces sp. SM14 TaxID=1736045 RepID=UPI000CD4B15A|nr:ABC transporter ATP-binding protein [Streptomyces sp. SM14]
MTADTVTETTASGGGTLRPGSRRGAFGRVWREGRPFLWRRRGAVARLGAWSLVEFTQTFLTGFGVAQALDRGFLTGRPGVGLAWLALAAVAALPAAVTSRALFSRLADLVEPLRDGLVRRASAGALHEALTRPERAHTGAVSRTSHQSEIARDGWAGLVMALRSCVFAGAGALVGLAVLAPPLLLVVLPPLVAGWVLFAATLAPMAARQHAYLEADERLAAYAGALAGGLRDVAATGGGERLAGEYAALTRAQCDAARALARWSAVRVLALALCGRVPPLALLAATPWLLGAGMTPGALVGALTYLTVSLTPAVQALMTALGTAGGRLLVVLDRFTGRVPELPPARAASADAGAEPAEHGATSADAGATSVAAVARRPGAGVRAEGVPGPAPCGVELTGVSFAYGPGARPVLDGLDLTVRPGEHLAVLGPSGTGKSTLATLLAGDLSPGGGLVRWRPGEAGAGARRGPPAGTVLLPQHPYVFTGPLRDNLRYLRPSAPDAELADALAVLGLEPLLRRLGGLDSLVEPARLSMGERQLLVAARALVTPSPLLVMDEATSHVDPVAEHRVETALAAHAGTLVVVAHRPSSARRADRVLLLDGPRVECGPPSLLARTSALYRELTGAPPPAV